MMQYIPSEYCNTAPEEVTYEEYVKQIEPFAKECEDLYLVFLEAYQIIVSKGLNPQNQINQGLLRTTKAKDRQGLMKLLKEYHLRTGQLDQAKANIAAVCGEQTKEEGVEVE